MLIAVHGSGGQNLDGVPGRQPGPPRHGGRVPVQGRRRSHRFPAGSCPASTPTRPRRAFIPETRRMHCIRRALFLLVLMLMA